jgi:hypothetical protein
MDSTRAGVSRRDSPLESQRQCSPVDTSSSDFWPQTVKVGMSVVLSLQFVICCYSLPRKSIQLANEISGGLLTQESPSQGGQQPQPSPVQSPAQPPAACLSPLSTAVTEHLRLGGFMMKDILDSCF